MDGVPDGGRYWSHRRLLVVVTMLRRPIPLDDLRFPYDHTVTILVGPSRERFNVNRGLLCQHQWFRDALDGAFKESRGELEFPKHDSDIFRFFIYWLSTAKLEGHFYPSTAEPSISAFLAERNLVLSTQPLQHTEIRRSLGDLTIAQDCDYQLLLYRDAPFDALIGLYVLAEYLQIRGLKDQIINRLVDVYSFPGLPKRYPNRFKKDWANQSWAWKTSTRPAWVVNPFPSINAAFSDLPHGSTLCRLLIRLFCDNVVDVVEEVEDGTEIDTDFLRGAFTLAQDRTSRSGLWLDDGPLCDFHDHDGGESCQRQLKTPSAA
ncbi:MAG: hypothetical protein Q9222_001969 [Ikaeria aurantiellina]